MLILWLEKLRIDRNTMRINARRLDAMVFQSVVGMQSLCQGCGGNFTGCQTSVRLLAHVPFNFVFPFICMTGTSFFLLASFYFSIPDCLFFYPKADRCWKSLPLQPHLGPTITPPFISIPITIIPRHATRVEPIAEDQD